MPDQHRGCFSLANKRDRICSEGVEGRVCAGVCRGSRSTSFGCRQISECVSLWGSLYLCSLQILQQGSQMRGEVKTKIRELVASTYRFRVSQSSKSREYNFKRAATLKEDLNFTYKVSRNFTLKGRVTKPAQELTFATPEGNVSGRKGLYRNIIIQKALNAVWFAHRRDEGVLFSQMFDPVPLPTIALILTAVRLVSFLLVHF